MYLRILRIVEKRVHSVLGWDTLNWRPLNACRACCYKASVIQSHPCCRTQPLQLKDEPQLPFSRLYSLDGNSSLKRAAMFEGRTQADVRVLDDSTYWLPRDYVDSFAGEVRSLTKNAPVPQRSSEGSDDDDDDDWDDIVTSGATRGAAPGDPTDGLCEELARLSTVPPTCSAPGTSSTPPIAIPPHDAPSSPGNPAEAVPAPIPTTTPAATTDPSHQNGDSPAEPDVEAAIMKKLVKDCVKNWKAAADDDKKRMWAAFDESGIFACACRHGLLLWIVDMVRSGEL